MNTQETIAFRIRQLRQGGRGSRVRHQGDLREHARPSAAVCRNQEGDCRRERRHIAIPGRNARSPRGTRLLYESQVQGE